MQLYVNKFWRHFNVDLFRNQHRMNSNVCACIILELLLGYKSRSVQYQFYQNALVLCGVCHETNSYLYRCIKQPKPNFLHLIYCTSILFAFYFMICSASLWPAQKYQWFQRRESQKHRNKSTSLYSSDSCMSIGNHCIEFLAMIKKKSNIFFDFQLEWLCHIKNIYKCKLRFSQWNSAFQKCNKLW